MENERVESGLLRSKNTLLQKDPMGREMGLIEGRGVWRFPAAWARSTGSIGRDVFPRLHEVRIEGHLGRIERGEKGDVVVVKQDVIAGAVHVYAAVPGPQEHSHLATVVGVGVVAENAAFL